MFSTRARATPAAARSTPAANSPLIREVAVALSSLVKREDLTTQELTLIRNLADPVKFIELVGTMSSLMFSNHDDATEMVRDLARVDTSVPARIAIAKILDLQGDVADLSAAAAAQQHALQIVKVMVECADIQGSHACVSQERIQAMNERAHALNELLPPRWPDVFRMVWRRVCGVRIVAPDPGMTKAELIRRFVDASPEEVARLENLQQGTQEWLDARRFRISGSTVASLVNLSPYASFDEWVVDKLYHHTYSNAAMRHGSKSEAGARMLFERAMRLLNLKNRASTDDSFSVVERGFMMNPELGGWAGASPDGLVSINGLDAVLEIKCPFYDRKTFYSERDKYHLNPWGIPEQYYCQIQYLMHLLRRPFSYFVVHLPEKTQIMFFKYNPQFACALYDTAREVFYHKFLPTAIRYFRGELSFGCASVQDVIDLRASSAPAFCIKRRRVSDDVQTQSPGGGDSSGDDEEAIAAEARIRDGLRRIEQRNEHDRYSWSISVCNICVTRLASLIENHASDEEHRALKSLLRLLPSYVIEDSTRGRQLCDAFIRALEHDAAAVSQILIAHATSNPAVAFDLASPDSCPFEAFDENTQRTLHAALSQVSSF